MHVYTRIIHIDCIIMYRVNDRISSTKSAYNARKKRD